jgi:hypothetical protein
VNNYVKVPSQQTESWYEQNIWFIPLIAVLLSAFVVHKLTQFRDWEKGVSDLYDRIQNQVDQACEHACQAWTLPKGPERKAAIAATLWRTQQLGQSIAALERRTERIVWGVRCFIIPWPSKKKVAAGADHIAFRKAITEDPFYDNMRRADKARLIGVEHAKGSLLTALDTHWDEWTKS